MLIEKRKVRKVSAATAEDPQLRSNGEGGGNTELLGRSFGEQFACSLSLVVVMEADILDCGANPKKRFEGGANPFSPTPKSSRISKQEVSAFRWILAIAVPSSASARYWPRSDAGRSARSAKRVRKTNLIGCAMA